MKFKVWFFLFLIFLAFPKNLLAVETTNPITDRFYTGQIKDDTGLYYYNARYYDPQLGIFTSADRAQGPNRYAYVGGNPIMRNDPTGEMMSIDEQVAGSGYKSPGFLYYLADPLVKYSPIMRGIAMATMNHRGGYLIDDPANHSGTYSVNSLDLIANLNDEWIEHTGVGFTKDQWLMGATLFFSFAKASPSSSSKIDLGYSSLGDLKAIGKMAEISPEAAEWDLIDYMAGEGKSIRKSYGFQMGGASGAAAPGGKEILLSDSFYQNIEGWTPAEQLEYALEEQTKAAVHELAHTYETGLPRTFIGSFRNEWNANVIAGTPIVENIKESLWSSTSRYSLMSFGGQVHQMTNELFDRMER